MSRPDLLRYFFSTLYVSAGTRVAPKLALESSDLGKRHRDTFADLMLLLGLLATTRYSQSHWEPQQKLLLALSSLWPLAQFP